MDFDSIIQSITTLDFAALFGSITFEIALASVVLCIISAFFALRLFKIYISAVGAFTFGYIGYYVMLILLDEGLVPPVDGINLQVLTGLVAAILGFLIASFLHKVVLFVGGAAGGFLLGNLVVELISANVTPIDENVALIISGVVALVIGALVCAIFKPIYIFVTSIGGMALAAVIVSAILLPLETHYIIIAAIVGALIGIIPMIYQFKRDAEGNA